MFEDKTVVLVQVESGTFCGGVNVSVDAHNG